MAKHQYRYLGDVTVNLPLHGIIAAGGDQTTLYETDLPIEHPDFEEIHKSESKRKETQQGK